MIKPPNSACNIWDGRRSCYSDITLGTGFNYQKQVSQKGLIVVKKWTKCLEGGFCPLPSLHPRLDRVEMMKCFNLVQLCSSSMTYVHLKARLMLSLVHFERVKNIECMGVGLPIMAYLSAHHPTPCWGCHQLCRSVYPEGGWCLARAVRAQHAVTNSTHQLKTTYTHFWFTVIIIF